jgi:hypothetical protein
LLWNSTWAAQATAPGFTDHPASWFDLVGVRGITLPVVPGPSTVR